MRKFFWLVMAILTFMSCQPASDDSTRPPNILLILMDDLGWSSISSYGNKFLKTEHIDRLAEQGMKFTNAYATPQCTPTRATLLTGMHTVNNRMWHVVPEYSYPYMRLSEPKYLENLPKEAFTLGEALQKQGYRTACLGKWHLHVYGEEGYYTRLFAKHAHDYGFDYVDPVTEPSEYQKETDKGVNFLTDQAIEFATQNKDAPFFIYLSHHTIHGPILAPETLIEKYRNQGFKEEGPQNATYLAAIEHFDQAIGRLLDRFDKLGISKNTLIIFTSDNGGVDREFDNAPLRQGKGSPYEGGIRVPFIVRWPGYVKKGSVSKVPVHTYDIYPTLVEAAGGNLEEYKFLDGESIIPILNGAGPIVDRPLFWYAPLYDANWGTTPAAMIRKGNFKLIKYFGDYVDVDFTGQYIPEGRIELYNLEEDLGEQKDISKIDSMKTLELLGILDKWLHSSGVDLPEPNPNYNPDSLWIRAR